MSGIEISAQSFLRKMNVIRTMWNTNKLDHLVLTGGGRLTKRITNPAMIKKRSRQITIALNQMGNRLPYDKDMTSAPTSILSAIGSRNEPNLLACDGQLRAIKPSAWKTIKPKLKERLGRTKLSCANLPNRSVRRLSITLSIACIVPV